MQNVFPFLDALVFIRPLGIVQQLSFKLITCLDYFSFLDMAFSKQVCIILN